MGRIDRRSRKWRASENGRLRRTPRRVVEYIENFHPELDDMVFAMRHLEFLVQREIDGLEVRCDHCVPPKIAEGTRGGNHERGRIVPSVRSRVRCVSAAG